MALNRPQEALRCLSNPCSKFITAEYIRWFGGLRSPGFVQKVEVLSLKHIRNRMPLFARAVTTWQLRHALIDGL